MLAKADADLGVTSLYDAYVEHLPDGALATRTG
jgi:hypothetical protein